MILNIQFTGNRSAVISKTFSSMSGVSAVCKPGYYSTNHGIAPCVECPMGTYQDNDQRTQCHACPAGTRTASTGSTSLEDCLCKYFSKHSNHEKLVKIGLLVSVDVVTVSPWYVILRDPVCFFSISPRSHHRHLSIAGLYNLRE